MSAPRFLVSAGGKIRTSFPTQRTAENLARRLRALFHSEGLDQLGVDVLEIPSSEIPKFAIIERDLWAARSLLDLAPRRTAAEALAVFWRKRLGHERPDSSVEVVRLPR
jgi:hypothetical protein